MFSPVCQVTASGAKLLSTTAGLLNHKSKMGRICETGEC